jgi:membrane protease YdiL (CAAX protease family)
MQRLRLLLAMVAPVVLVAMAMGPIADLRLAFFAYVFGGCFLVPWMLVGARPGGSGGLPFRRHAEHAASPLLAVFLFGPCFLLAYWLLRKVATAPEPYLEALRALGWEDHNRSFYFASFLICVPLAEEWWWRGQALPRAELLFGRRWGAALVALGFASYHAPVLLRLYPTGPALIRLTGIVVAGCVWTWIAARRRSWGWVWWAHLTADAVVVLAFILWVAPQA